jgi:pyroglutamyl-peptidase
MKTILLTGFEPFAGEAINPSWELVKSFHGHILGDYEVQSLELPCVFHEALSDLTSAIARLKPDFVFCLGQAGGRAELSLERVAINIDDARIPDNQGKQPIDAAINPKGSAAYFTNMPIKAMLKAMKEAGVPTAISQTAGTFVCNHVFYGLMDYIHGDSTKGLFIHIPYLPEQAAKQPINTPSMSLETMRRGLNVAMQVAIETDQDIAFGSGALH